MPDGRWLFREAPTPPFQSSTSVGGFGFSGPGSIVVIGCGGWRIIGAGVIGPRVMGPGVIGPRVIGPGMIGPRPMISSLQWKKKGSIDTGTVAAPFSNVWV